MSMTTTINQVGVGSVIFNTSLGIPVTLNNVLHIPGVRTCFLFTCALAQKGAEIPLPKTPLKLLLFFYIFF
jgi:hypothetical protein